MLAVAAEEIAGGAEEAGASETVSGTEEAVTAEIAEEVSDSLEIVGWEFVSELSSLGVSVLSTALLEIEDVSS